MVITGFIGQVASIPPHRHYDSWSRSMGTGVDLLVVANDLGKIGERGNNGAGVIRRRRFT